MEAEDRETVRVLPRQTNLRTRGTGAVQGRPHPRSSDLTLPSPTESLAPRALFTLVAAACTAACAPIVTHGPRVEQGFTFYGTGGGGRTLCDRPACDTSLVPQQGTGLRYGHAASASAPGWSAGLTASAGWLSSDTEFRN